MNNISEELLSMKNHERAKHSLKFFKTGIGEYGEGDLFLGLTVPEQRKISKKYVDITFKEIRDLLNSKYHEFRFTGIVILTMQYEKGSDKEKKIIFDFYIKNMNSVNNWDLVDVSAHKIVGDYLFNTPNDKFLINLAKSDRMWDRRIAMVSCLAHIKNNNLRIPVQIATILLDDKHDLMHKAVGWMLREIGKKDEKILLKFLDKYASSMPRTALRYSIERLNENKRKYYLSIKKDKKVVL